MSTNASVSRTGLLEGKVAVITGAGQGIGRAIARRFAAEGAYVVIGTRTASHGEAVLDEIRAADGTGTCVATDVAEVAQIRRLVEVAHSAGGRIDVLVNNVGIGKDVTGPFWEVDDQAWDETFAVNVRAMFLASKYAYPHMPDGAAIVNMGSVASLLAYPDEVCYVATKGAILQMTKAMACDCAPRGIRVNCLCPGSTLTPGMQKWIDEAPDGPALKRQFASSALLNRMGDPEEVAAAALFLASDEASFVTGIALPVDGGWTAGRYTSIIGQSHSSVSASSA